MQKEIRENFVKQNEWNEWLLKSYGMKISGIYCIRNLINNKIYIGSSNNIYYRLRRHFSDLLKNRHGNPILQNSFNKYRAENFVVSIIEKIDKEILAHIEQCYIDTLKPEYNITILVIRNTMSESSKEKLSKNIRARMAAGTYKLPTHENEMKPINIYDLDCNCLGKFKSRGDGVRFLEKFYPNTKNLRTMINHAASKSNGNGGRYKQHFILPLNEGCIPGIKKGSLAIKGYCLDTFTNEKIIFESLQDLQKIIKCSKHEISARRNQNNLILNRYLIFRNNDDKK